MELIAPIPTGMSVRAASLLLAVCLLAQLSYLDHIVAAYGPSMNPTEEGHISHAHGREDQSEATSDEHVLHCHDGVGSCSEVPMTAGPGQLMASAELLPVALMSLLVLQSLADDQAPAEAGMYGIDQPPRDPPTP
jgi:hypothetical protein